MLNLVYDSLTGNVRRFTQELADELNLTLSRVQDGPPAGEFLLLTYTFGTGEVPASTRAFLQAHSHLLRGVVGSGSFHWGKNFARAADRIAAEYHVPVVAKLNKGGTESDHQSVVAWLKAQDTHKRATSPALLSPASTLPWRPHGTLD